MIQAVIFDMDGLLLDSEVYWEQARAEFCESHGCTWTPEDELMVKGNNSAEWAQSINERCHLDVTSTEIIRGVSVRMRALYDRHLPLLPGAVDVVRVVAVEYPLAIASSSPPELIEHAMTAAGIRECFAATVSADRAGRGKPAPDVFLLAAKELGVAPSSIAVFEDSSAGIASAHAAGMTVIAVPNPHYPPSDAALSRASLVLPSLEQFRIEMLDFESQ